MERPNVMMFEDEIMAQSLQNKPKAMSYAVSTCVSGYWTALQIISEHRPEVELMDILLAGQLACIETAGQTQRTYDIQVIDLISA